jgi:Carboxypeptidase regulatory-like domain/TonB dependent receptor
MRKMQSLGLGYVVLTLVALLCSANPAFAQDVTATITGTITDSSGAPLAGATVTAKDLDRGTVWPATTNTDGIYNILRIPVGSYSFKVEAKGFQTALYPPFTLVLNQTARVDVQMKVGAVTETIEVTGETPLLQTQSNEVSTLIDAHTVTSLALASRNYLQLTLLAPGATTVNPDSLRQPQTMLGAGRPYINGNREQANEYLLDGQLNSEDKNNEVGYTPPVDAIQEFNLITQNASSEFGNYEGGVISASIKSGTNSLHGGLYEFFRNDYLNANNASAYWTKGLPAFEGAQGHYADGTTVKPTIRYNQFGGTIGGPILKDKLFFFADYQGQRIPNKGETFAQLLTSSARAGDFGQLCASAFTSGICGDRGLGPNGLDLDASGNPKNTAPIVVDQLVVPGSGGNTTIYVNPAQRPAGSGSNPTAIQNNNLAVAGLTSSTFAKNLFADTKLYPLPQIDSLNGPNYTFTSGNNLNNDQGDLKIDYILSSKDHIFGRWSQMDLRQDSLSSLPVSNAGAGEGIDEPVRNAVASWTHSFSASLQNEARIGFNAVRFNQRLTPTSGLGNISEQLGIAGGNFQAPGLLGINISGNGSGADPSLGLQNLIQIFHTTQAQIEDNFTVSHGRHTFRTGFQFVRERQNYIYPGNNGALGFMNINTLTGSGLADFWLGNVVSGNRDTGGAATLDQLRGSILGFFGQDDWRITPTLTLNLGLRFEDHTPLYEVHNRVVNFNLMTGALELPGQNGNSRALYNNYLGIGDWLPRVGFAWSPSALHGKTVVRGGFAMSSYTEGGGSNEELTQNVPYGVLQQSAAVGPIENGFGPVSTCGPITISCYQGIRVRIFDQNFRPALSEQWNLTIQHQFSNTLTFQIGYVGQHSVHLLNFQDVAQREGLNAQGTVALPGQLIVSQKAGPYLGGGGQPCVGPLNQCGAAGSLFQADQNGALAGTNMSNASQRYNALQAVLQKRMSNGLQAQVSYTFSKCLSDSPGYFGTGWGSTQAQSSGGQPGWENIFDERASWGPCYFDQKHILTSYVIYQLPLGRGKQFGKDMNKALNAVVGNWELGGIITLHTGNALTLNNFGGWGVGGNTSNTNGVEPQTLSGVPNCSGPVKVLNQYVAANATTNTPAFIQYFDPTNVSVPAPNTFGTCSVGNISGPGYANVDFSMHKGFAFTENKRLEFRMETLNLFNRPVYTFFGGPAGGSFDPGIVPGTGTTPGSNPNFGHFSGSQGARQIQLALKFLF